MYNDNDINYVKKQKIVHYGSLEDSVRMLQQTNQQQQQQQPGPSSSSNINTSNQYFDLKPAPLLNNDRQNALEELERKRRARQIAVSTDDIEVRAHLRNLNQPICLFGEGPADRRERLRQLLARLGEDAIKKNKEEDRSQEEKEPSKTWYHVGSENLLKARQWIAEYSIPKAKQRLEEARVYKQIPYEVREANNQELYKKLRSMEISCSQVADQRPISSCSFSPNGSMIATSSWSGLCKIWSKDGLQLKYTLRGHNCNVDEIAFHPRSTIDQSEEAVNLASCSVDGCVHLWNLGQEEPIHSLNGHQPYRVSSIGFHPSGRFLATCCYDNSWRLWDLDYNEEILHQEGHSKPVHEIDFQQDGSVVATGGRDGFGRIWDLRTGRCIMFMDGHLKGIISISFSPNGYQIVTGSEDNSVKIWNLRERKLEYTIAAHTNIVSKVRFEHNIGNYIMTASYDNTIKLWSHPSWTPIKTLSGHDGKVMCIDVSNDNNFLISCSFDRTFKLWEQQQNV
ncbi:U4-U6 small nuclear riboprotein factor 60K [Dermatophagoides pteronyssinus]|uniref:U4-U6 small nuclear riboprotein factor 60K n=1 Tax=Dermatophagoides pteronyssinus TaxID=6956 RepID=UPI003F668CA1